MKVRASTLKEYDFCPRAIYLRDVLEVKPRASPEQTRGLLGHAVRKELALRQPKIIKDAEKAEQIKPLLIEEFDSILEDVPFIYREKLGDKDYEDYMEVIRSEIDREIDAVSDKLRYMLSELGREKVIEQLTPWKVEYSLRSDKLKLSGRIDKIMKEKTFIPIERKTGAVGDGIWEGDRLQVCAYAMLLEDKFDCFIPYGFVEYTRVGEQRPVLNTEQLRRRVIDTRDSIIRIIEGELPEISKTEKKCRVCGYREECYKI